MDYFEFEGKLFGGVVKVSIYDMPKEEAQMVFDGAYAEGLRLQRIFNFYDQKSELSKLNRERKLKAPREMLEVLTKALEYCEKTGGAYDISIGKQIIQRKSGKEVEPVGCTFRDIKLDEKTGAVELMHEDVLIDLGSIAKGYIGDKIAENLKQQSVESFFIDARGDMLASGKYEETVEVQHPREATKAICSTKIKNSAVATSGDYNQYYGNYKKSHILGQKDLISVTVIAKTLMDADVFASAVFLLEKKERDELIKANPQFKVFTVNEALEEKSYNGFFVPE